MLKLGYDVRHEDISGLTLECLCRPWSQHDDATPSRMLTCTLGVERSSFIGTGFSMQGVKSQVSHLRQGRWTGLVLCWKNSSKSPWRIWEAMYSLKKREQSLFRADICSCFVDFSVTGGRLRRWRLFRLMGCVIGTVWFTSLCSTYVSYCSSPSFSVCRTVSATAVSTTSQLLSTRRSLLYSANWFPISSMARLSYRTSSTNAICACLFCSWWRPSVSCLLSVDPSNSWIKRATSGPNTIQLRRATVFSLRRTSPPTPFTEALFCSWAWSVATAENAHFDFLTTKFRFSNSAQRIVWTRQGNSCSARKAELLMVCLLHRLHSSNTPRQLPTKLVTVGPKWWALLQSFRRQVNGAGTRSLVVDGV